MTIEATDVAVKTLPLAPSDSACFGIFVLHQVNITKAEFLPTGYISGVLTIEATDYAVKTLPLTPSHSACCREDSPPRPITFRLFGNFCVTSS